MLAMMRTSHAVRVSFAGRDSDGFMDGYLTETLYGTQAFIRTRIKSGTRLAQPQAETCGYRVTN